ncbi:MAG TPA: S26 family signal peptidase, partial [Actinomycetota bacterium]|nr:S26 family signal peptidase [Actinomycetota bacterium]
MNRPRKLIASSLAVVVVATLWFLFAPRQIPGGSVSYVVPSGTSMLPTYERGDVVILREASSYRPGDVVAYESDDLRRLVLH